MTFQAGRHASDGGIGPEPTAQKRRLGLPFLGSHIQP